MQIYTIGFTQKSAEKFFTLIKSNAIETLIDVRLWNSTQLSGFSKGKDLRYFLKELCECGYEHRVDLAPTKELLDDYKNGRVSWEEYEARYRDLILRRNVIDVLCERYNNERICLLCAEPTAAQCHRRLLAEMIAKQNGTAIVHI